MEKDIGKIKKNDTTDIVVRLDDFGGKKGLTIREFVTGERYTGFTKSGVRIPAADFNAFKEMINSIGDGDLVEDAVELSEDMAGKKLPKSQKKLQEEDNEMPDY